MIPPADWFFTPRCIFCDRILRAGQRPKICPQCDRKIPNWLLLQSQQTVFHYEREGRCLFLYENTVREMMHRFKYESQKGYATEIARLMWQYQGMWLKNRKADALIAVPIHPSKLRTRGYNQAKELAEALSNLSGVPLLEAVQRVRKTTAQKNLGRSQRLRNLSGALCQTAALLDFVSEKRILTGQTCFTFVVVDDIYTTGSTVENVANSILLPPPYHANIIFWCACRSKPDVADTSKEGEEYDGRYQPL